MYKIPLMCVIFFASILNAVSQDFKSQKDTIAEMFENDTTKVVEKVKLNWISTYDEALQKAKDEKKPVLIYFTGSDWCAPCITLDKKLFYTDKFKNLSDKELVLLEVDFPRNQQILSQEKISENIYLRQKFKVNSFPTLLFLNHKGKKVAEKTGYILSDYYYPFIESVLLKN